MGYALFIAVYFRGYRADNPFRMLLFKFIHIGIQAAGGYARRGLFPHNHRFVGVPVCFRIIKKREEANQDRRRNVKHHARNKPARKKFRLTVPIGQRYPDL